MSGFMVGQWRRRQGLFQTRLDAQIVFELCWQHNARGNVPLGISQLARQLGVHRSSVHRSVDRLVLQGHVVVSKRGIELSTRWPSDMSQNATVVDNTVSQNATELLQNATENVAKCDTIKEKKKNNAREDRIEVARSLGLAVPCPECGTFTKGECPHCFQERKKA